MSSPRYARMIESTFQPDAIDAARAVPSGLLDRRALDARVSGVVRSTPFLPGFATLTRARAEADTFAHAAEASQRLTHPTA